MEELGRWSWREVFQAERSGCEYENVWIFEIPRGVQRTTNNPEWLEHMCIMVMDETKEFPGVIKPKTL